MTLKELIMSHEGLRLKPYHCTAGKLTIGIGRNLDDVGISSEEASFMLENDIKRCIKELTAEFPWLGRLGEVRQAVLIDMCFNMGLKRLCGFKKTLKLIEEARYEEASKEMLNSAWASQVKSRATTLSNMMRTGIWP
jgi:lysozyme